MKRKRKKEKIEKRKANDACVMLLNVRSYIQIQMLNNEVGPPSLIEGDRLRVTSEVWMRDRNNERTLPTIRANERIQVHPLLLMIKISPIHDHIHLPKIRTRRRHNTHRVPHLRRIHDGRYIEQELGEVIGHPWTGDGLMKDVGNVRERTFHG